jgi:hypothetical protein
VVEPDGDQGVFAARKPGVLALTASFGRLMPNDRQFPEAVVVGELAAQGLVVGDRQLAVLPAGPVAVQQPCPEVAGGAQQPVAAVGLVAGGAQADVGGAMHQPSGGRSGGHVELMFDADGLPVKARRVNVERLLIIGARKPNLRSALRGTRAN